MIRPADLLSAPTGIRQRIEGDLADFVARFPAMDAAAAACDCSRPALYRRLADGGWRLAEFIAACCWQRDQQGHLELLDRLAADIRRQAPPAPVGDQVEAIRAAQGQIRQIAEGVSREQPDQIPIDRAALLMP